jgi:hypothetical protein
MGLNQCGWFFYVCNKLKFQVFQKSESKKCWIWEFEKETRIKESLGFKKGIGSLGRYLACKRSENHGCR